ncbi:thioesterase II family protein [Streptomyces sp. NPDC004327]|uniref:thioesterase II family protein n=1 Tax=unclassified Streptomyces TaxID=2593676 RepID=UPI00368F644B
MTGPRPHPLPAADLQETWLRRPRPVASPRARLICFPHAGGAASFFRDWPRLLPADVEVQAVCYPGREDRIMEDCAEDLDELADRVTEALAPLLDRPVVLFGHSMGASVAHEVALRIERRYGPVLGGLVVSSRTAPAYPGGRKVSPEDDEALLRDVAELGGTFAAALDIPELRELMLPVIRADYRMLDAYRPGELPRLAAPVVGYIGDGDPQVTAESMGPWAESTTGGFTLSVLPGDHFYLIPEVQRLAGELTKLLAAV